MFTPNQPGIMLFISTVKLDFFCLMSSRSDPFQPRDHKTKESDRTNLDREIKVASGKFIDIFGSGNFEEQENSSI